MLKQIQEYERRDQDGDTLFRELSKAVYKSEATPFQKAKVATKMLLDATNTMGSDREIQAGFVAGILETHRHLQSQGILAILTALGNWGKMAGQSDARNEHAKETCELLPTLLRERIYWKDLA